MLLNPGLYICVYICVFYVHMHTNVCVHKKPNCVGTCVFNFILLECSQISCHVKILCQIEQKLCETLQMKRNGEHRHVYSLLYCVLKQALLNGRIAEMYYKRQTKKRKLASEVIYPN